MTSSSRSLPAAVALAFAAVLLLAGCASGPGGSAPSSSPDPSPDSPAAPAPDGDDRDDVEAAWLDEGRMFAVVTWGSSTCVPTADEVTAEGQTVTVALVDPQGEDLACTDDLAPRASIGAMPAGVDPTQDVELRVTYGEISDDADLDGDPALTGTPGEFGDSLPSAGWIDDDALVLLTWGSSTCLPVVETLEGSGTSGTVTFVTDETRACTMDLVPRTTLLFFEEDAVEDDGFELTLVGGGLDGTVSVRG